MHSFESGLLQSPVAAPSLTPQPPLPQAHTLTQNVFKSYGGVRIVCKIATKEREEHKKPYERSILCVLYAPLWQKNRSGSGVTVPMWTQKSYRMWHQNPATARSRILLGHRVPAN